MKKLSLILFLIFFSCEDKPKLKYNPLNMPEHISEIKVTSKNNFLDFNKGDWAIGDINSAKSYWTFDTIDLKGKNIKSINARIKIVHLLDNGEHVNLEEYIRSGRIKDTLNGKIFVGYYY